MSFSFHRQIPNRISTSIKKATKTLHSIISTSPFAQRPPTLAIFSDIIRKIEVVNQSKALASILPYMVELLRSRNKKRIFPTPRTTGKRSSFLQINPQKLKKRRGIQQTDTIIYFFQFLDYLYIPRRRFYYISKPMKRQPLSFSYSIDDSYRSIFGLDIIDIVIGPQHRHISKKHTPRR